MTIIEEVRAVVAVAAGRAAAVALRALGRGATAGPGLVADLIAPGLVTSALNSVPGGLIVVSGSSGKSTTTKMLAEVLEAHGVRVFTNSSTANLRQGVTSAVVASADSRGRLSADVAVVELDEGAAARLAAQLHPSLVVLTNVSLDQLDRFHSMQTVAALLTRLARRSDRLVVNAGDPLLRALAADVAAAPHWFGVPTASLDLGTTVLETTGARARILIDGDVNEFALPDSGLHYALDAAAALEAARVVLGEAFDTTLALSAFAAMAPVFGRGEVVEIDGEKVKLVLVQNPDSFRRNLGQLRPSPTQLMIAIGSDVRDASWLWSVDMSTIGHVDVVSGSNAYEMGARLAYEGVPVARIDADLAESLSSFLAMPEPAHGMKTIIFSADSMRRVRRQLRLDRSGLDRDRTAA